MIWISKNILIVDDDPAILQLITMMLKKIRPKDKILTVETVKDALLNLTSLNYDVIISDYNLPDGTGKTIFTKSNPKIFKIGISGMNSSSDFEKTTNYFLQKPFGLNDLMQIFTHIPDD